MMSDRRKGEKARQPKGLKANLGQKKAARENAAARQLGHMGGGEKPKVARRKK
jgi:hypothetical protein